MHFIGNDGFKNISFMEVHDTQVIKAAKDIKMNLIPNKYSSMIKRVMPNKF